MPDESTDPWTTPGDEAPELDEVSAPMQIVTGSITVATLTRMAEGRFFGTPGFVEFDSVINIRPRRGNRSRSVEDPQVRAAIVALINRFVKR